MKTAINLLCISLLFLFACDKDDDNNLVASSTVPVQINSFPLAVGNAWKYHTEATSWDSAGQIISSGAYDNYWTVISDTIINGLNSYKIQQIDSNYNGSVNIGYTYYTNQIDGFYGVGVENYGSMFEMKESMQFISDLLFEVLQSDTVFIPITPMKFLQFPSNISDTWYSIVHIGSDTLFTYKAYTGFKTVTTGLGNFNCIRVQSNKMFNGTMDMNYTVYQDFGNKGLIAETVRADSLFFGSGYGKFERISKLTQINF